MDMREARGEKLRVDAGRLSERIAALAETGTTRLAFSPEDTRARERTCAMMREAGLEVRIDPAANIIGRREGSMLAPAIVCGSHIDTVPGGGRFDGALGVLAGIECLQVLDAAGFRNRHPMEVVVFSNEEGQSYAGLLGSRAMAGALDGGELGALDAEGRSLAEALREFGGDPDRILDAARTREDVRAYLELHVEQGGVLEADGLDIGVVEGIVGIRYLEVTVSGRANHAGTTPMELRRDALVASSDFVAAVDETIRTGRYCRVATIGRLEVEPNSRNVIPGRVRMTLELRDMDPGNIDRAEARLREIAGEIESRRGVRFALEEIERLPAAAADPTLIQAIEGAATRLELSSRRMPSGAGHDAQMLARVAPMGMIFVPSAGGISHSAEEHTDAEACARGADVLLQSMLDIDTM